MSEQSWTTVDKTGWGDGPWNAEPDKLQWVDEQTGLDCLVVRNLLGALCGYVGVPPEHLYHGVSYNGIPSDGEDQTDWPDVHGGLTHSESCDEDAPEGTGICHVPQPGRPANVWWLGFDCAHHGDVVPVMAMHRRWRGWPSLDDSASYRTINYVRKECASLAAQLASVMDQ